jgi:hypothetical protein
MTEPNTGDTPDTGDTPAESEIFSNPAERVELGIKVDENKAIDLENRQTD